MNKSFFLRIFFGVLLGTYLIISCLNTKNTSLSSPHESPYMEKTENESSWIESSSGEQSKEEMIRGDYLAESEENLNNSSEFEEQSSNNQENTSESSWIDKRTESTPEEPTESFEENTSIEYSSVTSFDPEGGVVLLPEIDLP